MRKSVFIDDYCRGNVCVKLYTAYMYGIEKRKGKKAKWITSITRGYQPIIEQCFNWISLTIHFFCKLHFDVACPHNKMSPVLNVPSMYGRFAFTFFFFVSLVCFLQYDFCLALAKVFPCSLALRCRMRPRAYNRSLHYSLMNIFA